MKDHEGAGKSPSQELKNLKNNHLKEQSVEPHKVGEANALLAPLMWEKQSWYERSHEELVKGFRSIIQERVQLTRGYFSPEETVRSNLWWRETGKMGRAFFSPLRAAWDVLAYDRYEPGSIVESEAGSDLQYDYLMTHETVIKLSQLQVRIIDALTEAVEIPHERGQVEIEIPENFRYYREWTYSKEYRERLAKAQSKRNK